MKIILIAIFTLALFTSCESVDSESVIVKDNLTEDFLSKNPHFEIYNSDCTQDVNSSLCGYLSNGGTDIDSIPTFTDVCDDTEYCL